MVIELSEVLFDLYLRTGAQRDYNACMYPYVRMLPVCYSHLFGSEILTKTPHGYIRVACEYKENGLETKI